MRYDRAMPPTGILPSAGQAVRLGATGYSKETFPILATTADGQLRLRPICELALAQIRAAGADRVVVVISPHKTDVVRVLGSQWEGVALGYAVQAEPRGLPEAVCRALTWIGDGDALLALPDTVVTPPDALARVHAERLRTGADLVLGVVPVGDPSRFGPVEIGPDGSVLAIHDKPSHPAPANSWAVASWNARFSAHCRRREAERATRPGAEPVLGHVFASARATLDVRAVFFPDGELLDIGTPEGLRATLRELGTRGEIDASQAQPLRVR